MIKYGHLLAGYDLCRWKVGVPHFSSYNKEIGFCVFEMENGLK
jgi:hypothetical protein